MDGFSHISHTCLWTHLLVPVFRVFPCLWTSVKPSERLTVSLRLWSFADLSLTAWELPAKTSNEILALTAGTGEGWNVLFPNRFSFLASLHLKDYWGMSLLFPFLLFLFAFCSILPSSSLSHLSAGSLSCISVSAHCNSKSGWGIKV